MAPPWEAAKTLPETVVKATLRAIREKAVASCLIFMVFSVGVGVLQRIYGREGQFIPFDVPLIAAY
jgi:hypothetical protein